MRTFILSVLLTLYLSPLNSISIPLEPSIQDLVVLNINAGRYEFSTLADGEVAIFQGEFADLPETRALFGKKGGKYPPHFYQSISIGDAYELSMLIQSELPAPPSWLKGDKQFVVMGEKGTIFAMATKVSDKAFSYTKTEIWDLLLTKLRESQEDPHLKKSRETVGGIVSLILVYAVMDRFGIERLTYLPS